MEKVVCFDFSCALGSQSLLCVAVEQAGQEISGGRRNNLGAWEVQWLCEDLAVHVVCVLIIERRQACQHLVQEDTECPPIDSLSVAGSSE